MCGRADEPKLVSARARHLRLNLVVVVRVCVCVVYFCHFGLLSCNLLSNLMCVFLAATDLEFGCLLFLVGGLFVF